jgi:hypothetical protein
MDLLFDMEILMMIPLDIIIEYPSDFDDNYFENRLFKQIRDYLSIDIDVCSIMDYIGYNCGRRENGSVSIYYSNNSFKRYILLDTYIGTSDQLDLINVGFCCPSEEATELRKLVRKFYDETCKYNIYYCEGTNPIGYKYQNNFAFYEKSKMGKGFKPIEGKRFMFYKCGELLLEIS